MADERMDRTSDLGIVGIPEPGTAGVRFNSPPADLIPEISGSIQRAVDQIGLGKNEIALVAVADRKGGWNSALVGRVGDAADRTGSLEVLTWIGKGWGTNTELDYGARVQWKKKL